MRQPIAAAAPAAGPDAIDALVDRAVDVLGTVFPSQLRALLSTHGPDRIEMALRHIEAMETAPRSPWGLFCSILDEWRAQGVVVRVPRPAAKSGDFRPRDFMQNYNPGPDEPIIPATLDERAAWRDWRRSFASILGEAVPEKTPARGSHGNVSPEPGRELSGCVLPAESYPSEEGATRPTAEHQTPQDAVRFVTPLSHTGSASFDVNQGIAEPSNAPVAPDLSGVPLTWCNVVNSCSHNFAAADPPPAAPDRRTPDPGGRTGPARADPPDGAGWPPDIRRRC